MFFFVSRDFALQGRPYLWVQSNGKPAVRNNHYVPRRGDDWLVFTSLRSEIYILLPDLPRR
jgi:hypothetical protein